MLTSQIKELNAAKERIAKLEAEISRDLHRSLSTLHSEFGFNDLPSFITAVKAAAGTAYRSGRKSATKAAKRTRAVITPATHAAVKKLTKAGETGAAIAEELGISLPSVQNIKKALGLVKSRKPKPAPKKKAKAPAAKKKTKTTAKRKKKAPGAAVSAAPVTPVVAADGAQTV